MLQFDREFNAINVDRHVSWFPRLEPELDSSSGFSKLEMSHGGYKVFRNKYSLCWELK